MPSIIRRLMNRLYPENLGERVTILGLDYSGKTTLLYLLKLGQIVQTIPSIGFNVETVNIPIPGGQTFRMYGWDLGTGCGITYLYGLIQVYVEWSKAVIWVVDLSDKERLGESVESLQKILANASKAGKSDGAPKSDFPVLILANKSDKSDAMSLDQIRVAFAKATSGRLASVFKTSLTDNTGLIATGLLDAFGWLQLAIEITESRATNTSIQMVDSKLNPSPNPRSASSLAHKLESWLMRIETDVEPDEFLRKFHSFTLPEWDHYTHIRIAYLILTKHGRREGKDMIFKGLEKYISVSPQTKGRSFHVTMTYFWIQIVHFGIRNVPPPAIQDHVQDTASSEKMPSVVPDQLDEFSRFLLINPYVADGNLWSDYYSKEVMMSQKAKDEMVLPNKKPLPNLVIRDTITTFGAKGN